MKQLVAILFSVLIVQMQIAPVSASLVCQKTAVLNCGADCGQMNCCTPKPANSQPAPAVPQSNTQNHISFLALAMVIWNLPEKLANFVSSDFSSHPATIPASFYARNCALLL